MVGTAKGIHELELIIWQELAASYLLGVMHTPVDVTSKRVATHLHIPSTAAPTLQELNR